MSADAQSSSAIARLAVLRQREVEQRQGELARQLAEADRQRRSQERLDALWRTSTTSGTLEALPAADSRAQRLTPELSANCSQYKQTVLELASRVREDLSRQEQVLDQARLALLHATQRHGALDQLLTQRRQALARAERTAEQKRQDEIARQSWQRRSP